MAGSIVVAALALAATVASMDSELMVGLRLRAAAVRRNIIGIGQTDGRRRYGKFHVDSFQGI